MISVIYMGRACPLGQVRLANDALFPDLEGTAYLAHAAISPLSRSGGRARCGGYEGLRSRWDGGLRSVGARASSGFDKILLR